MPPLFTNIINNNNISSSAIFKLNFNQFTYSGGNNNMLSDFILITTLGSPHKRRKLVTFIWQLAHDPLPYKAIYNSKN